MKALLVLMLFFSCAHLRSPGEPRRGKTVFSYSDVSGNFSLAREVKNFQKKLVTRTQILVPASGADKVVEKTISVGQIGTVKDGHGRSLIVRPLASEFTVWLEGKKYSSRMQLNPGARTMRVTLESPEPKWNGVSEVPFPRGKYFCFYTQIPDCLYHSQLLSRAYDQKERSFDFHIIWDNFPYVQEQLTNVGKNLFSFASLKYDGELKGRIRYIIDVEEQILLYQFTKNFELSGFSWISQGITMVAPGEEVTSEEE